MTTQPRVIDKGFWLAQAIDDISTRPELNRDFEDYYIFVVRGDGFYTAYSKRNELSQRGTGSIVGRWQRINQKPELLAFDYDKLSDAQKKDIMIIVQFIAKVRADPTITLQPNSPYFTTSDFLNFRTSGVIRDWFKSLRGIDTNDKSLYDSVLRIMGISTPLVVAPAAGTRHGVAPAKKRLDVPVLNTPDDARLFARSVLGEARKRIIGQDKALRQLLTAYVTYIMDPENPRPLLLCGPTGTGKTLSLRILAELTGVPFTRAVLPDLTPAGYRGSNIQSTLANEIRAVIERYSGYPPLLVFQIDEIDKIVRRGEGSDGFSIMLQNELLKLLEPGASLIIDPKDGSPNEPRSLPFRCMVVMSGAFSFVEYDTDMGVDERVLTEAGFINEFIGRIGGVIPLRALTHEDFVSMLTANPPLPFMTNRTLAKFGLEVELSSETNEKLARMAEESGMGGRHLSMSVGTIHRMLLDMALFDQVEVDARSTGDRGTAGKAAKSAKDASVVGLTEVLRSRPGLIVINDQKLLKVVVRPEFVPERPKQLVRRIGFGL